MLAADTCTDRAVPDSARLASMVGRPEPYPGLRSGSSAGPITGRELAQTSDCPLPVHSAPSRYRPQAVLRPTDIVWPTRIGTPPELTTESARIEVGDGGLTCEASDSGWRSWRGRRGTVTGQLSLQESGSLDRAAAASWVARSQSSFGGWGPSTSTSSISMAPVGGGAERYTT